MAQHNDLGKAGEEKAITYLENKGYTILEKNWEFQKAEIDVLAKQGDTLVVIEVKTRSSTDFGLPQDFVKPKKIQLLTKAVNEYVLQEDLDVSVRFDIIAIVHQNNSYIIEHIEDAFYFF
jgi:putative endonuclease